MSSEDGTYYECNEAYLNTVLPLSAIDANFVKLFHWFGGSLKIESFLSVSGRGREHFLPDQLRDTFFKTRAAFSP